MKKNKRMPQIAFLGVTLLGHIFFNSGCQSGHSPPTSLAEEYDKPDLEENAWRLKEIPGLQKKQKKEEPSAFARFLCQVDGLKSFLGAKRCPQHQKQQNAS